MVPLHGLDVFRPRKTIYQVLSAWYQTLPGPCSRACVLARSTSWRPALGPPGMGCPSGRHWAWAEMGTSIRPRPRAHELSKVNSVGTWNLWWKFHHPRWLLKNGNYPRISRHRLFLLLAAACSDLKHSHKLSSNQVKTGVLTQFLSYPLVMTNISMENPL